MRTTTVVLSFFLIVCFAVTLAATNKDIGRPQAVDPDSSSTFDVGAVLNALPLDTVQVPLYFFTTNLATMIENRLNWTSSDLTLVDVTKGEGVDGSVTLTVLNQTSDEVQFKLVAGGSEFDVDSQPIAYLHFEVTCELGFSSGTAVTLADNDNYNYYVSGGLTWAPLRLNGGVSTFTETYLYLYSFDVTAYAGQQDIPVTIKLYQDAPGTLDTLAVGYDDDIFRVDSVTALPDLQEGTVTIESDVGGILQLTISSPVLPGQTLNLFDIHFATLDDRDNVDSFVGFLAAFRTNLCGFTRTPNMWGTSIEIPDHWASADIGDISKIYTSSYYDVPFEMDSNYPINAYEFWIEYPAEDIYFDRIVVHGEFAEPTGVVDPNDSTLLNINNGSGTDYLPEDLPANVFSIRFRPWSTPSAGTVFDIDFVNPHSENTVLYDMDLPGFHVADPLTLVDGSITITGGGGPDPCCPALYVWNGREFALENNILAQCDGERVESDVTDFYLVNGFVVAEADELRFQVRENTTAVSEFDNFQLLVIDHPKNEPIHVTREGAIVTSAQPFKIKWAKDHTGRDITELISTPDNLVYRSEEDGWFEVSLGVLHESQVGPFAAAQYDSQVKKRDCPVARSNGIALDKSRKLKVAVQNADGGWDVISSSDARHNPVRQSTLIDAALIEPGRELVLRYMWESHYRIDVLEFRTSAPYEGDIDVPAMLGAVHSEDGVIATRLGAKSSDRVTLEAGESIELVFDASDLPRVARGFAREYVFVTTGKYEDASLADRAGKNRGLALDANKPNPFNPTTTITYNLPEQTWVELSVYDVSGALVRTLVSGRQPAGEKSVTWEGRSEAGAPMASGVYFYRLKTPGFEQTRKMVLLK
jgi:hypothetical protein